MPRTPIPAPLPAPRPSTAQRPRTRRVTLTGAVLVAALAGTGAAGVPAASATEGIPGRACSGVVTQKAPGAILGARQLHVVGGSCATAKRVARSVLRRRATGVQACENAMTSGRTCRVSVSGRRWTCSGAPIDPALINCTRGRTTVFFTFRDRTAPGL